MRIVFLLLALELNISCSAQKLIINGFSSPLEEGAEVVIEVEYPLFPVFNYSSQQYKTAIKAQKFQFKINVSTPELYRISILKKSGQNISSVLFLEPGVREIHISDTLTQKILVLGSKANFDFVSLNASISNTTAYKNFEAYSRWAIKEKKIIDSLVRKRFDSLFLEKETASANVAMDWIQQNPKSYINAYVMLKHLYRTYDENKLKSLFASYSSLVKKSSWGKELEYLFSALLLGKKAPGFTQADVNGKEVSLYGFRGHYILLDFWASWCLPCRKITPDLIEIYKKYGEKNFVIISVSLDHDKKAWTDAVKKDGMIWINLSDLKGNDNAIAKAYHINPIPANFLIGPEGQIIAKNINPPELDKKLNTLLKK